MGSVPTPARYVPFAERSSQDAGASGAELPGFPTENGCAQFERDGFGRNTRAHAKPGGKKKAHRCRATLPAGSLPGRQRAAFATILSLPACACGKRHKLSLYVPGGKAAVKDPCRTAQRHHSHRQYLTL